MAANYLIPHPNIPTTDIGIPKMKEVTLKNNENFLALDSKVQSAQTSISSLADAVSGKADADHTHDDLAKASHTHSMEDINLLKDNLDLKAPLIHTHEQYLTEIPSHGHKMEDVANLPASLAAKSDVTHTHGLYELQGIETFESQIDAKISGKADAVHTHTEAEVTGLLTDLANKVDVAGAKAAARELATDQNPTYVTVSNSLTEPGTSTEFARADHKHFMQSEKTTPNATKGVSMHGVYPSLSDFYDYPDKAAHPTDPSIVYPEWQPRLDLTGDHVPPGRMTGDDNETPVGWERGKTAWKNGHDVDKSHPAVGCSMTVCTHMRQVTISGESKYQALFSRIEFDESGLIVRVVPCSNWYTMM